MDCRGIKILYYGKKDASSGKSLAFLDRSSDGSLM